MVAEGTVFVAERRAGAVALTRRSVYAQISVLERDAVGRTRFVPLDEKPAEVRAAVHRWLETDPPIQRRAGLGSTEPPLLGADELRALRGEGVQRILWWGYGYDACLFVVAAVAIGSTGWIWWFWGDARWAWRRLRRRPGTCVGCGYDLRDLTGYLCPECGRPAASPEA